MPYEKQKYAFSEINYHYITTAWRTTSKFEYVNEDPLTLFLRDDIMWALTATEFNAKEYKCHTAYITLYIVRSNLVFAIFIAMYIVISR